jgi:hypothetical protein
MWYWRFIGRLSPVFLWGGRPSFRSAAFCNLKFLLLLTPGLATTKNRRSLFAALPGRPRAQLILAFMQPHTHCQLPRLLFDSLPTLKNHPHATNKIPGSMAMGRTAGLPMHTVQIRVPFQILTLDIPINESDF